jgi:hypothetical protein
MQLRLGLTEGLVFAQYSTAEPAAGHLLHLINQNIANSANIALKTATTSQHDRLAVGTTIGEFGKVQFDTLYPLQWVVGGIDIVGKAQHMISANIRCRGGGGGEGQKLHDSGVDSGGMACGIGNAFEGVETQAAEGLLEGFAVMAMLNIGIEHSLDDAQHFGGRK